MQCPRCQSVVESLQTLDSATVAMFSDRAAESIPPQICTPCFNNLMMAANTPRGGSGSVLLQQERAKEQRKMALWKSRTTLIKKARRMMGERAFSEAAVAYEKYLRVVELVFDAEPGSLTPEQFKDSARTTELTVVASVYWDLLRIYDTSDRYLDRQGIAAQKLGQFLRFTPIYPDIMKKADSFSRTARNPAAVKHFLKMAAETKGKCFIASAAFEYEAAPEVVVLRRFRDEVLRHSRYGEIFIAAYERISPSIAQVIRRFEPLRPAIRMLLRGLIKIASLFGLQ